MTSPVHAFQRLLEVKYANQLDWSTHVCCRICPHGRLRFASGLQFMQWQSQGGDVAQW